MADLRLSVSLSPSWRDAIGRFARPPVGESLDAALYRLGQQSVRKLAQATPVKTGAMRAGWRSTLVPTRHQVRITNQQTYAPYVAYGTRQQPPNPALRAVLSDLPDDTRVELERAGRDIVHAMAGG